METIMQGINYFHKGGFVMYILLVCSIFVISIGIERICYFTKADSGHDFTEKFYWFVTNNKIDEAKSLVKQSKGDLANLLFWGMDKTNTADDIMSFWEVQSGISLAKFRTRLYYLNVIVTMAPLLGLLGTISGMISAFSVFNLQTGQSNVITGGIGEALIATAMGLCVSVTALIIHAYFTQRIDRIITDMEQSFSIVERYWRGEKSASA